MSTMEQPEASNVRKLRSQLAALCSGLHLTDTVLFRKERTPSYHERIACKTIIRQIQYFWFFLRWEMMMLTMMVLAMMVLMTDAFTHNANKT